MKRLLIATLLCLAVLTGTARADTWVVFAADTGPAPTDNASLLPIWQRAGSEYGIPWQVLAAINKIETDNGRNLSTSSAGAIGWMQFMPGTWLRWGTDANGDGIADPWNAEDAIYSAARYLAASGGQTNLRRAIYAYNHADWYVARVLRLAGRFGNPASPPPVRLGELRTAVEQAKVHAASASAALTVARASAGRVGQRHRTLAVRSTKLPLFTARLAYQRLASLAAGNEIEAHAALARAERTAAAAQARCARSRSRFAAAARARRLAVSEARRRERAARATSTAGWAQQLPWFDGFTGASALRVTSAPTPVVGFTLNP